MHASQNKLQTAFMCPTEILAEQHYKNMIKWFFNLGVKVDLLLGSTKAKDKKRVLIFTETGGSNIAFPQVILENFIKKLVSDGSYHVFLAGASSNNKFNNYDYQCHRTSKRICRNF